MPLLAAAAWALMARPGLGRRRAADRAGRAARVPLAAGALTAWDVFLDPRMVREGYWSWPRRRAATRACRLSNFAGWLATGARGLRGLVGARSTASPRATDDGALALYVWTWAGETFANAVALAAPARRPPPGRAAMGAFAVPALRAAAR